MLDETLNIKNKDEAAKAYEAEVKDRGVSGVNCLQSFLDGIQWYEYQLTGLTELTPDQLLTRVLEASSELELLQLSTVLLVNAHRYTADVAPQIAQALGDMGQKIVLNNLKKHQA